MSTAREVEVQPPKTRSGARRFHWSSESYQKLVGLDLFRDRRVELLEGEIIEMSPHNAPHANAIERLISSIFRTFGGIFRVRIQLPINLGLSSVPEPDAAVIAGEYENAPNHPHGAVLVVEASDTSLDTDRNVKSQIYAQAGIPEYWICNIPDRQLEVHRRPEPDPKHPGKFHYAEVAIVPADGFVSPLAKPDARIAVADLLP
jgi:Uma2 family endonuclease